MRAGARRVGGPAWAAAMLGAARRVLPWVGLSLSAACGRSCGAAEATGADASSSTTDGGTTSSGSTGPSCWPDAGDTGGYDPCPPECAGGGQCLFDGVDRAVCTRGCFDDCDCWPAPGVGAAVRCSTEILAGAGVCVLDCGSGGTCPAPMTCVEALSICAHPYEPPETTGDASSGSSGGGGSGTTGVDDFGGTR